VSSVLELEKRSAIERTRLIHSFSGYLDSIGIKAELTQEPKTGIFGASLVEVVILLKGLNINKIRLISMNSSSCGAPGDILRFQYEVHFDKALSAEQIKEIPAATKAIKEGKIMNLYGGKVVGITWIGQKLATLLNEDQSIHSDLLKCINSSNSMDFYIDVISGTNVNIIGPQFAGTEIITELYNNNTKKDIECCIFGYRTVEKIAEHIRKFNL